VGVCPEVTSGMLGLQEADEDLLLLLSAGGVGSMQLELMSSFLLLGEAHPTGRRRQCQQEMARDCSQGATCLGAGIPELS
jgi:hypothetical protein